jgi:hypothetical protein
MLVAMERQFQCPSCGAANTVTNPGVLMRVCDYCKTAMYWDKDSVLRAGNKSLDLPPPGRFKVGASGKLRNRSFTVLGRLVYSYGKGTWTEWFVEMQDGSIMWLTEDEGELFLESQLQLTSPVPRYEELTAGMQIALNDKTGVVEEIGEARCIGGEGQIPFQVEIGETYPYADGAAADGSFSFGLEYDKRTGTPSVYIGKILEIKDSKVRREDREAPIARTGEAIRCASCGKPYEGPRVETTKMVVCQACGAALELDEAETRVVGRNQRTAPRFCLKVGTPIALEGTSYQVMGRLSYTEVDEGTVYRSFEYVLYNQDSGYVWLSEENGHFTISRVFHSRVAVPPIPIAKMRVRIGLKTYRIYEAGEMTLEWVDGALPWTAAVGEKTRYVHMIAPPDYVDQEITGQEVELFQGRYISHNELSAGLPQSVKLPAAKGVYSCQPYEQYAWTRGLGKIAGAFVLLNILLLVYGIFQDKGTQIWSESVTAEQYSQEYLAAPFKLDHDRNILRLRGSAPVNNSWLSMDFAVVDADDRVLSEFYGDASYYSGTDSEGSWTEGSHSFSSYFKVPKAGTYRLLVSGSGGSGNSGPSRNETISLRLTGNNVIYWYFFIPIVLAGLLALMEPVLSYTFEQRRWAQVMKDDDDDGGNGDDD